jgi:hypothetical protein
MTHRAIYGLAKQVLRKGREASGGFRSRFFANGCSDIRSAQSLVDGQLDLADQQSGYNQGRVSEERHRPASYPPVSKAKVLRIWRLEAGTLVYLWKQLLDMSTVPSPLPNCPWEAVSNPTDDILENRNCAALQSQSGAI